jgi:hypothetical protein
MKHRFFKFGIGLVILAATTTSTQLYIGFLQWGQEFGTLGQFNRVAKVIESMDGYSSPQNRLNRELTLIDIDHLNFFIYKIKTPDGQTAEVRFDYGTPKYKEHNKELLREIILQQIESQLQ